MKLKRFLKKFSEGNRNENNLPPQHPEEDEFGYFLRYTLPKLLKQDNPEVVEYVIAGDLERIKRMYGSLLKAREKEIRQAMQTGRLKLYMNPKLIEDRLPPSVTIFGDEDLYVGESHKAGEPYQGWLILNSPKEMVTQIKDEYIEKLKREGVKITIDDLFSS